MVWLMLMPNGLLCHQFIEGKFGSRVYIELLRRCAVPISKLNYGNDYFFQENNSAVHKAKAVKKLMLDSNINVLEWPAKSPDINIFEDIWKMYSSVIYDGRQFNIIMDLKTRIGQAIDTFNTMKQEDLKRLYVSIRQRI